MIWPALLIVGGIGILSYYGGRTAPETMSLEDAAQTLWGRARQTNPILPPWTLLPPDLAQEVRNTLAANPRATTADIQSVTEKLA